MLGTLAQWRDWQEVHEALRELVEGQEKLNGETGDLSRTTLAKPVAEGSAGETACPTRRAIDSQRYPGNTARISRSAPTA